MGTSLPRTGKERSSCGPALSAWVKSTVLDLQTMTPVYFGNFNRTKQGNNDTYQCRGRAAMLTGWDRVSGADDKEDGKRDSHWPQR